MTEIDKVYAVSILRIGGKDYFLVASEAEDGKCILINTCTLESSMIWDSPGGTMSLIPMRDKSGSFLAIQRFFPIFRSENACIVFVWPEKKINRNNDMCLKWNIQKVLDVPFVHRIEIVEVNDTPYIVVASLCSYKYYTDDWSSPGAIYIGNIPKDFNCRWELKQILGGVSKNHGMHIANQKGQKFILIAGAEGVFKIIIPKKDEKEWKVEKLIDTEVSDVFFSDIDNDNKYELITIEPFHGNELVFYKQRNSGWDIINKTPINFGHALWAGKIFEKSCVIVGNRGGEKDISIYFINENDKYNLERVVIDKGVGSTQIVVGGNAYMHYILAANNNVGEVTLYNITQ